MNCKHCGQPQMMHIRVKFVPQGYIGLTMVEGSQEPTLLACPTAEERATAYALNQCAAELDRALAGIQRGRPTFSEDDVAGLVGDDTVAMLYERVETWKAETQRCQDRLRLLGQYPFPEPSPMEALFHEHLARGDERDVVFLACIMQAAMKRAKRLPTAMRDTFEDGFAAGAHWQRENPTITPPPLSAVGIIEGQATDGGQG